MKFRDNRTIRQTFEYDLDQLTILSYFIEVLQQKYGT